MAPDSLSEQSRREPDGTGLGWFGEDSRPRVDKRPVTAYEDREFAHDARERRSRTFVAHVRFASTGGLQRRNTHPFEQAGRLFADNGVIGGLQELEAQLGDEQSLVEGHTDSERFFALITKAIDAAGGDVAAGIGAAARWVTASLPVFSINLVLVTDTGLWALRYPDTHDLFVLERAAGGTAGGRHLDHASAACSIRVRSGDLASHRSVVVTTERTDEDPAGPRSLPVSCCTSDRSSRRARPSSCRTRPRMGSRSRTSIRTPRRPKTPRRATCAGTISPHA